jgi:crossover junction endodeoxyribonuclease RuvC
MAAKAIRVLGIDPASAGATGFAVVDGCGARCAAVHYGILPAARNCANNMSARLRVIYTETVSLIEKYVPDQIALEAIFTALNVGTALRLAEVRGVILLAAAQSDLPVYSYSPRQVKATIAGYGQASKEQIQHMVRALLCLEEIPQPSDAADALAVALCHLRFAQMEEKFGAPVKALIPARSVRPVSAVRATATSVAKSPVPTSVTKRNISRLVRVVAAS